MEALLLEWMGDDYAKWGERLQSMGERIETNKSRIAAIEQQVLTRVEELRGDEGDLRRLMRCAQHPRVAHRQKAEKRRWLPPPYACRRLCRQVKSQIDESAGHERVNTLQERVAT